MPLPDPRPSQEIAKVFPQSDPAKDQADVNAAAPVSPSSTLAQATNPVAATIPLPEPRPKTAPGPQLRHPYLWRYYLRPYYPR